LAAPDSLRDALHYPRHFADIEAAPARDLTPAAALPALAGDLGRGRGPRHARLLTDALGQVVGDQVFTPAPAGVRDSATRSADFAGRSAHAHRARDRARAALVAPEDARVGGSCSHRRVLSPGSTPPLGHPPS